MRAPKPIPEEYQIKFNGCRRLSPYESSLHNLRLHEIRCPVCGVNALETFPYPSEYHPDIPAYQVTCEHCDWTCPVEPLEDCGESVGLFKEWLAAFHLIGEPEEYVNVDCSRYFHPENNVEIETISEIRNNNNEAAVNNMISDVVTHGLAIISKEAMCNILEGVLNNMKESEH